MARDDPEPRCTPATQEAIRAAADALRRGRLVVFPTETVYGLGADARNAVAVTRLFAAKGRPPDNPLIVHAGDAAQARTLVRAWPAAAQRLADAFWPGPLTLVLPRAHDVPDAVTAGLDSVGVRVPDHPVARALLQAADRPVAAPSANRSGAPSPTRCRDAAEDLGDSVAVYLDDGPSRVGVESTVVSLLGDRPRLLRPGGVPVEALESVAGPVEAAPAGAAAPPLAPGMKYRHYAPRALVHLMTGDRPALEAASTRLRAAGHRVAIVATAEHAPEGPHVRVPGPGADAGAWAHRVFALMRDLDREGYTAIVVEQIGPQGLGRAVVDRMRRAAERGPGDGSA